MKKDIEEQESTIKESDVRRAEEIRIQYRRQRTSLDDRVIGNERYWKLLHNQEKPTKEDNRHNTSAWLFNSIINKHADYMDNIPEPNILPREESDRETAILLNRIVPTILKYNNFADIYAECAYDKVKSGTSLIGVFWNNDMLEGLGDVCLKQIDILNVDWQPGIEDIQESKNLFITKMVEAEDINEQYDIEVKGAGRDAYIPSYESQDYIDESGKVPVTDWYYKKRVRYEDENGIPKIKTVLHYVKYCMGNVLYASENEEDYKEHGWYNHGLYPIVVDVMYPEKNTPVGFGNIDIMKNPQLFIDELNDKLLENIEWNASPRWLAKNGSGINMEDYLDTKKKVIEVEGSIDELNLRQIQTKPIESNIFNLMTYKVEELKETSGNRDFSQGSTASGVTSGSAIAALMEAGSKLSRDALKTTYTAYNKICHMIIELMRQFYTEERTFRIVNPNDREDPYRFEQFDNSKLQPQIQKINGVELGGRKPIFDVECVAQKASPFSKLSQNELAKELYQLGFFNPELADQSAAALQMMEFEGRELVEERVSQNGGMFNQIQSLQMQVAQLSEMLMGVNAAQQTEGARTPQGDINNPEIDSLGKEVSKDTRLKNVRENIRSKTEVQ